MVAVEEIVGVIEEAIVIASVFALVMTVCIAITIASAIVEIRVVSQLIVVELVQIGVVEVLVVVIVWIIAIKLLLRRQILVVCHVLHVHLHSHLIQLLFVIFSLSFCRREGSARKCNDTSDKTEGDLFFHWGAPWAHLAFTRPSDAGPKKMCPGCQDLMKHAEAGKEIHRRRSRKRLGKVDYLALSGIKVL